LCGVRSKENIMLCMWDSFNPTKGIPVGVIDNPYCPVETYGM